MWSIITFSVCKGIIRLVQHAASEKHNEQSGSTSDFLEMFLLARRALHLISFYMLTCCTWLTNLFRLTTDLV